MPSTPVLVLIALTVLACAFIVALLLRIRAHRLQVTPVFGSYGGIDRASNPMWRNRVFDPAVHSGLANEQGFVATNPRYIDEPGGKAKAEAETASQAAAQYVEQRRARKQFDVSPDELERFNEARTSNLK